MVFRLLPIVFILVQLGYGQGINTPDSTTPLPPVKRAEEVQLFLPLVSYASPIEIQIMAMGVFTADPRNSDDQDIGYVFGYLINTSQEPLYDTSLLVTEKYTFNATGSTPLVYTRTVYPAFTTTLPGQANLFAHISSGNLVVFHRIEVIDVEVKHASRQSPGDPTFVALNASEWTSSLVPDTFGNFYQIITGTVRNDSRLLVTNIRVVLVNDTVPSRFGLQYPRIDPEVVLQPGESLAYRYVDATMDVGASTRAVAQGLVIPPPMS